MGVTKTALFTKSQNEMAAVAKALAHPARIAIIEHLFRQNECINSDLVSELGLAQATISQHLRELKECGILQGTIQGVRLNYCINSQRWTEIQNIFNCYFSKFTQGMSVCCSDH